MARAHRRTDRCLAVFAVAAAAVAALGGCASVPSDGGFGPIAQTARQQLGMSARWDRSPADRAAIDRQVSALLAQPLSADGAVQVAVLNNRGLQAAFSELGMAEADRVQAGRLPNPGFSFGRLRQGSSLEIDRSVQFDLARLLLMPLVTDLAARQVEQTRRAVAQQLLSLAFETRRAHVMAVAAEQSVRYMRQVQLAAEAGADLARRQAAVGNWSTLQQAREQSFYADAALSLALAEQARSAARERLIRCMGLWGEQTQFQLPERLPDLPAAPTDLPDIEQIAMAQRLDVQAAKLGAEQLAKNLGLVRTTRIVNVFELGLVRNSFDDQPPERGYTVSVELPLFDWGDARTAKAEAAYTQALHRVAETAVNARSDVRVAYSAVRSSYDIARHYRDEIVPLRQRIADENLLRYNGMLIGVFELLADARAQIASVHGAMGALRDFWLAQADLDMALIGASADPVPSAAATLSTITDAGISGH